MSGGEDASFSNTSHPKAFRCSFKIAKSEASISLVEKRSEALPSTLLPKPTKYAGWVIIRVACASRLLFSPARTVLASAILLRYTDIRAWSVLPDSQELRSAARGEVYGLHARPYIGF